MNPTNPLASRLWRGGFSLIELLVVVSIISILASIAIPNFLDAQTRAKVARMKADMKTLSTAIEIYHTDNNNYPFRRNTQETPQYKPPVPERDTRLKQLSVLTTPISYMSSFVTDIFESNIVPPNNVVDYFDPVQTVWLINSNFPATFRPERQIAVNSVGYLILSVGPDGYLGCLGSTNPRYDYGWSTKWSLNLTIFNTYDPSNGTTSAGNIYYGSQLGGLDMTGTKLEELCH
jgi:type II secretion system protein G